MIINNMSEIILALVVTFLLQLVVLHALYFTDRQIKLVLMLGITQEKAKMFNLKKFKYFFVYYRRKEGIISKNVFVGMIAYYIVNFIGFLTVFIQLFIDGSVVPFGVLGFLNICLWFAIAFLGPNLEPRQKIFLDEYKAKERALRKQEKRKQSSKYRNASKNIRFSTNGNGTYILSAPRPRSIKRKLRR